MELEFDLIKCCVCEKYIFDHVNSMDPPQVMLTCSYCGGTFHYDYPDERCGFECTHTFSMLKEHGDGIKKIGKLIIFPPEDDENYEEKLEKVIEENKLTHTPQPSCIACYKCLQQFNIPLAFLEKYENGTDSYHEYLMSMDHCQRNYFNKYVLYEIKHFKFQQPGHHTK